CAVAADIVGAGSVGVEADGKTAGLHANRAGGTRVGNDAGTIEANVGAAADADCSGNITVAGQWQPAFAVGVRQRHRAGVLGLRLGDGPTRLDRRRGQDHLRQEGRLQLFDNDLDGAADTVTAAALRRTIYADDRRPGGGGVGCRVCPIRAIAGV